MNAIGVARQVAEMITRFAVPWQEVISQLTTPKLPPVSVFEPLYRHLLTQSWYVTPEVPMSLIFALDNLHAEARETELDDLLCHYFRLRLDRIELELIAAYPRHQVLLTDALDAHRAGKFTLSIPTLLTLADAIGHELWQAPFFCYKESRSNLQTYLPASSRPSDEPWLLMLHERGTLRESTKKLPPANTTLNRHEVMHGLRGGWNTETNRLKCVALLDYLHSLAGMFAATPPTVP